MVESILNSVLDKLADDAIGKFMHTRGVGQQVEKMRRELNRIQAFLKDADKKTIKDDLQKHWVKEVRDLAYDIEDVIDNAILLEVEVAQENTSNEWAIMRMLKKARKLPDLHELGDQINQILERIEEISNSRIKYGISDLGEGSRRDFMLPLKPPMLPDLDDPNVVGLDTHRDNIVKALLDENIQRRSVVSIVGIGGLGKTTLARKAYNSADVKKTFDLRIWIAVSQKFEFIDILKRILEQIRQINSSEQHKQTEYFLMELYKSFSGRKYLLVLDDVWTDELWTHIEQALVDANNGSRVLITSRNKNVAKVANPSHEPYKLPFLSEDVGLRLLLNKAICNQTYADDLTDVAKQLVKKCCGVPLALVVLGGLLSRRPAEYIEWNKLLQTMSWQTDGIQCTKILATSFDDLPLTLKYCFMYFAAFPKYYPIEAASLTRMWIAEGFIPQEQNRILEDTAERVLEELVQRSMVEVSNRSYDRSICSYHLHDLLRDLAIEKAKEDNFLTVCLKPDKEQSCCGVRRVAVHHFDIDLLIKYASPNLHTLLCFDSLLPNCSGHKLLKVLSFSGMRTPRTVTKTGLDCIEGLTQLKYLELHWDMVTSNQVGFVKLISGMKFLQTLDLRSIKTCDLSAFTWNIESLRHVMLLMSLGPPAGANLRNLQTLTGIKSRESWNTMALPNLPNLRTLDIQITEGFPWVVVASFLRTLKNLVNVRLVGHDISIEVIDIRDFPFYQQLTSLSYMGKFSRGAEVNLDVAMFPTHLTTLILVNCRIQQDPMAVLEQLRHLKRLYLFDGIDEYLTRMRCSAGGFAHLQYMQVSGLENLEEWEIEEGAMPMLQDLYITSCPMLRVPLGFKHLTGLRDLSWDLYGDQSATTKAKDIHKLCGHVPRLNILAAREAFC